MDRQFESAYTINPGYGSKGFSRTELRDIAVSVLALSLAMAIVYRRVQVVPDGIANFAIWIITSLLLVSTSFLLHEFGHKFVAQRYGAWAEYRMFPMGLVAAVLMSFFGFLFAAPGAVYISGRFTEKQNGIISAAGPAVNLVLAAIFIGLSQVFTTGFIGYAMMIFASFNSFLAFFNLIPIMPLDGSKILKWSFPVYLVMMAVAIAFVVVF